MMDSRLFVFLVMALLLPLSGCLEGGEQDRQDLDGSDPSEDEEEDPGPGSIRGEVTGFEGPMVGAHVDVSRVYVSTKTDEDGVFFFADVPPGEYRVTVTMDYYHRAVQWVEVVEGNETALEIELDLLMMTEEVPRKYGKQVSYVASEDTLLASAQVPVSDGAGATVTNETMNNTFPGFWGIGPEEGYLVAQLDVLVAWYTVEPNMPQYQLGIRYFRGEGPAANEIMEGETTEYHAPEPAIDQFLVRYYRLMNDDWLTWGPRHWQVGVVAEDFDETVPGGAAVQHIVQINGVLVAEEYAEAVS